MPIIRLLQKSEKLEIETYREATDALELKKTHVSFSGLPKKHPFIPDRIILIPDPLSASATYIEFRSEDISYVEELPSLVNEQGEVITMARLWVKKKSVAIRATPFVVEDIVNL